MKQIRQVATRPGPRVLLDTKSRRATNIGKPILFPEEDPGERIPPALGKAFVCCLKSTVKRTRKETSSRADLRFDWLYLGQWRLGRRVFPCIGEAALIESGDPPPPPPIGRDLRFGGVAPWTGELKPEF